MKKLINNMVEESFKKEWLYLIIPIVLISLMLIYKATKTKPVVWRIECYNYTTLEDTAVWAKYPGSNFGNDFKMDFGMMYGGYKIFSLMKFNVTEKDAEIYNVSLKIYRRSGRPNGKWVMGRILEDWDEMTVTYNTMPSYEIVGLINFTVTDKTKGCYYQSGYEELAPLPELIDNLIIYGTSEGSTKEIFTKEGYCPPVLVVCYNFTGG